MVILYDPFLQVVIKINDRVHKDNAHLLMLPFKNTLCQFCGNYNFNLKSLTASHPSCVPQKWEMLQ